MIAGRAFLDPAVRSGVDFFTGVPCSFLTPLINRVIADPAVDYVGAASEGEAVAIASGAWLAGRKTAVMFQNSGLWNAVNPLTSLNFPFRIPTLLICTWRAGPGLEDEPQHERMGLITPQLFDTIGIPHGSFPKSEDAVQPVLEEARAAMAESGLPFALIMEKGDVADEGLDAGPPAFRPRGSFEDKTAGGRRPSRSAVLERLLGLLPEAAAVIATTGKSGRELFTIADRPQHLYQVGSMGCAPGMGLGVALNAGNPVVVVDGDGALLMRMGTLATIGACAPENLVHIVLDNAVHDSTGGQPTVSANVNFAEVAIACGYRRSYSCDEGGGFEDAVASALGQAGPHLVHMRIRPGPRSGQGTCPGASRRSWRAREGMSHKPQHYPHSAAAGTAGVCPGFACTIRMIRQLF